jgi:predicted transcriptional regulator
MNNQDKFLFISEEIKEQQTKIQEANKTLEDAQGILKALEILAKKYLSNEEETSILDEVEFIPKDYSDCNTVPLKVLFALRSIERGTSRQVADALLKIDPTMNGIYALSKSREHLSELHRHKKINGRKVQGGKGYIYWLK